MRSIAEIRQHLPASPDDGLPADFVAKSRQQFGGNRLTPLPREPVWKKFLEKFDEPIIKILLAAALLSMFVDLFQAAPVTAGVALGVVFIAVLAALLRGWGTWVPSLLFISALALFFL